MGEAMPRASIQIDEQGVNVQGVLDAVERIGQRRSWLAVVLMGCLMFTVGLGGIVWWTLSTERDQLHQQVTHERFFRTVAEAKLACLEDRNPVFGVRLQRRGNLDECVTAELARRGIPRE